MFGGNHSGRFLTRAEREAEKVGRQRGTKTGNKMPRTSERKKKIHSPQWINEDTEQLDIWYTVYITFL